jgi:ElaB/YqjD/DUF883 family membrane-anchored ribosome-binding protein
LEMRGVGHSLRHLGVWVGGSVSNSICFSWRLPSDPLSDLASELFANRSTERPAARIVCLVTHPDPKFSCAEAIRGVALRSSGSPLRKESGLLIFPSGAQKVGDTNVTGSQQNDDCEEKFMADQQDPQEAANSAKEHVKSAADDFKAAASAKADEIRRAAEQKAEELRHHAEGKAREFRGAAETAWTDAQSKAKTWQADSETYIRENPTRAILVALGLGFLLGLLFRK